MKTSLPLTTGAVILDQGKTFIVVLSVSASHYGWQPATQG